MDAAVERAMDGLAKSRRPEAKRPSEHHQTDRSADLLHSFPYGSFGSKPDKSTQKCEEPNILCITIGYVNHKNIEFELF